MAELPITEPPETRIEEPEGSLEELGQSPGEAAARRAAAAHPECLAAWAALGHHALAAGDPVAAYAYFRTGYHRGLDRIRRAGWRGKGRIPWAHPGNRGFLASLAGLGEAAAAIGEHHESVRCRDFLADLAPDAPDAPGAG